MIREEDIEVGKLVVDNGSLEICTIDYVSGDTIHVKRADGFSILVLPISRFKDDFDPYVAGDKAGGKDELEDRVETFLNVCREQAEIYRKKNHDYGNSFEDVVIELGDSVALGQIAFKFHRLKQLVKGNQSLVKESLDDSISDLINYAIMWKMIRDKNNK